MTNNILPNETLEDQNKNKILQNLHHNLTLEKLEDLERRAKLEMPSNIIYQEVSEYSDQNGLRR